MDYRSARDTQDPFQIVLIFSPSFYFPSECYFWFVEKIILKIRKNSEYKFLFVLAPASDATSIFSLPWTVLLFWYSICQFISVVQFGTFIDPPSIDSPLQLAFSYIGLLSSIASLSSFNKPEQATMHNLYVCSTSMINQLLNFLACQLGSRSLYSFC